MSWNEGRLRYFSVLTLLVLLALFLSARILYMFLADPERFPISTIKIVADTEHVSRKQIESILSKYQELSFFSLSAESLQQDLNQIPWLKEIQLVRVWPDELKITLLEKKPIARWNKSLLTEDGQMFHVSEEEIDSRLPQLSGPENQEKDVLQNYQKLSKLLNNCGLEAAGLRLRKNQAWELRLSNGIPIRLGKDELEPKLQRFCKAYTQALTEKAEQIASVDLRYASGMAVRWKSQTDK